MKTTPNESVISPNNPQSSRNLTIERLYRSTVPSSDRPVIEHALEEAEIELKGYQTEINKLKAALASLEQKRDGLKKKIAKYRSLLSPIHRLPPEILQHIFPFTLNAVNWLEPSLIPPTLSLASVCGRWREIVLSTASLWSLIGIDFNKWERNFHILNRLVRLFLDRAGAAAFTLILDFPDKSLQEGWLPCLEALVRHSNRWHSLEFREARRRVIGHSVFNPIKGHLPILAHLDIDPPNFRCDLFSICPVLSSVELFPPSPFADADFLLPWGQVRNLTLWSCTGLDGLPVLKLFQNVDSLKLWYFGAPNEVYEGEHINLDIKHLEIHAVNNHEVCCILRNATFPSLSSIDIRGHSSQSNTWTEWEEKPIIDFLIRSSCAITSLSLKHIPISDRQTIWLLRHMPMLETLCLEEYSSTDDLPTSNRIITQVFLDKLTIDHAKSSSLFLPKLTRIKLVLHYIRLEEPALVKAIASRWITDEAYGLEAGVISVKSIDIVLIDGEDSQLQSLTEELQWMADAGLRVTVAAVEVEEDEDD